MSERISHQSDDNEAPNEWDILTSEQTRGESDAAMPAAQTKPLRKYYSKEQLQTLLETNPRKILC